MTMRVIELFYSTTSRGRSVLSQRFYAFLIAILAEFQSRVTMQISSHIASLSQPTYLSTTGILRPTWNTSQLSDDDSSGSSSSPSPEPIRNISNESPNMDEMMEYLLNSTSEVEYQAPWDLYP